MTATSIVCESHIRRVTVYARGAVVARRLALPEELPEDATDLTVSGVTALAEPGSIRAVVDGDRAIVALRSKFVAPPPPVVKGSARERVRELQLEKTRRKHERAHLKARRDQLASVTLDPGMARAYRRVDPSARVGDAIALSGLLSKEIEALDASILAIDEALERLERDRLAAELDAAQARTSELAGDARIHLDVLLRLAPGAPGGIRALDIEYIVWPARWFPAYAARFTAGATRVEWSIEALVAQASGEDWSHVELALSTADLVTDARLPELASLRLGRAQPAARKGYRPAPEGLDILFEGYDRFAVTMPPPVLAAATMRRATGELTVAAPPPSAALSSPQTLIAPPGAFLEEGESEAEAFFAVGGRTKQAAGDTFQRLTLHSADEAPNTAVDLPSYAGAGGPPGAPPALPPPPVPQPVFSRSAAAPSAAMVAPQAKRGGWSLGGVLEAAPARVRSRASEVEAGGGGGPAGWEAAAPAGIEPADAWLDFDALHLNDPTERASRGRLVRDDASADRALQGASAAARTALAVIVELAPPPHAKDPREGRGHFDHRYDAEGLGDIPSNGRLHRVSVASKGASSSPRFITIPREVPEVYREVEIKNPFQAPLLAGPVDVFVDGALLTQSAIGHVDVGGLLYLGLGVEDRIRVARNARVEEGSAGLLGGSTTVEHLVTIDLASSIGRDLEVTVIDRIPVTDDKDIEIKTLFAKPSAEAYTQVERGQPIRRGMRWLVPIPAGGKARVELGYRITLSSKSEIVGGNRREG